MVKFNNNFEKLKENYLFVDMAKKISKYQDEHPDADIVRLGIGDVTLPICPVVIKAMHEAVDDMAKKETFKGYGPSEGYDFLREAIAKNYLRYCVRIDKNEVYVSDGAKNDTANIIDIFDVEGDVLIPNPSYPVYVDAAIISGRNIKYLEATEENGFLPMPDYNLSPAIIYLCSPNNPTGAVYSKEQLKQWIDYAVKKQSVIIFDAAYESFIENSEIPHSIFEIENAKKCAIEICSLSKGAGFTGLRCAYTVVPQELEVGGKNVGKVWLRRQCCKFNGVSYITQKAALAAFSEEGIKQNKKSVDYYKQNAKTIREAIEHLGLWYVGGVDSPYFWIKCPNGMTSWEFFDYLLDKINVVGTPGAGFGSNGEGFFRISCFGDHDRVEEAAKRLKTLKFN